MYHTLENNELCLNAADAKLNSCNHILASQKCKNCIRIQTYSHARTRTHTHAHTHKHTNFGNKLVVLTIIEQWERKL